MKFSLRGTGRRAALVVLATGALIVSGTVVAMARDGGDHQAASAPSKLAVNSSGGVCKAGFQTSTSDVNPEDHTPDDNTPASTVSFTKGCAGAVSATLSGETNTSASGDSMFLEMRATCVGNGGFSSHHCTVGNSKLAAPGLVFFQTVQEGFQVHSMTEVFSGLNRGKWRFDVLLSGTDHAELSTRTFAVTAYNGG